MATQGIVTITQDDKVKLKIVAGCNGMKAPNVVGLLMGMKKIPSAVEAYRLAREAGFGSPEVVVLDEKDAYHNTGEDLHPRYRATFDQPEFNPRWEQGIADYVEVLKR